ncbi:MAG: hypothetical protein NZM12_09895 [Steroidobacteraceae bacterium]|nr:hypothetical protein [Steroidobacteraceae bacterium]MDW8258111.1 hypothetical protein [Gammaproteobacteria bacterium]
MPSDRRSDYDVTDTVQVSSPDAVRLAVVALFAEHWPNARIAPLEQAFGDFELMFTGKSPRFEGVDTLYHDMQHTLDITLAMARLMAGYERSVEPPLRLGSERALLGAITALFHDVGYLRERGDTAHLNGAEFTRNHVSRGIRFLRDYLPQHGLGHWVPVMVEVMHCTGYEKPLDSLQFSDPRDANLGALLGTADMIAQMADRCYIEKCRDRLYPEFVLGGMALAVGPEGYPQVRYASGLDLLRQTPQFIRDTRTKRLEQGFRHAYRYVEALYDGRNPYLEAIERNERYLADVLRSESWHMLRRDPPLFAAVPDAVHSMRTLMADYIRRAWSGRAVETSEVD